MGIMCNLSELVLERGMQQGIQQEKERGMNRLSSLSKKLQELGKIDDLLRATTDPAFLEELYEKYGI